MRNHVGIVVVLMTAGTPGCAREPSVADAIGYCRENIDGLSRLRDLMLAQDSDVPETTEVRELAASLGVTNVKRATAESYKGLVRMQLFSRGTVASGVSVAVISGKNMDPALVNFHKTQSRSRWYPVVDGWWIEVSR